MRCNIIQEHISSLTNWFFVVTFLFSLPVFAHAVYTIPSDRVVTWSGNVGVAGGIPTNYTKYGSTIETTGQGDDTSAIQSALNSASANQYIELGSGIFSVTGTITIPDGVSLRGQGMANTTLQQQSSTSGSTISFGYGSYGSAVNLSGGFTKGSTTITTATPHGWAAGDVILIDQVNGGASYDPPITNIGSNGTCSWCGRDSGNRAMGQLVRLVSASGTTATLEIPLYMTFDPALTPQGVVVNESAVMSGLESLKIDNSTTMNDNQNNSGTVNMSGAVNCWVKDVEIHGAKRMGINVTIAYRNTIHGVTIHKTLNYTSNNGYAVWLLNGASANLVENSIFYDLANGPIINGPISGNVVAYNYLTGMESTTFTYAMRSGISAHGGHSMMNLFEGNYFDGQHLLLDGYWGSSSHHTIFRNRTLPDPSKTALVAAALVDYMTYYINFVGNVFGEGGTSSYITNSMPYGPKIIYAFEFSGTDNTLEKALFHQNYDNFHDSVTACTHADNSGCQGGTADTVLPDSLYLSAKPSWYGTLPWPSIGPDLNPMGGDIPAKLRYEGVQVPPPPPPETISTPVGFDTVN